MSDYHQANVRSLLHCEGANNATTMTDSAIGAAASTFYGNAKLSTSQNRYGSSCLYLPGGSSSDYVQVGASPVLSPGTDWTFELSVRPAQIAAGYRTILHWNAGGPNGLNVTQEESKLHVNNGLAGDYVQSGVFSLDTWIDLAFAVKAGTLYIFAGGSLLNSRPAQSYGTPARYYLGRFYTGADTSNFAGYVDEIRLTLDVARYTDTYTPAPFDDPVAPTGKVILLPASCDPIFGGRHRIASTVDRLGVAGPYPVRLYHRKSGRLVRSAWSDEAGNYQFDAIAYEAGGYFAVAHDVDHGELLNAGIADLITPEPM